MPVKRLVVQRGLWSIASVTNGPSNPTDIFRDDDPVVFGIGVGPGKVQNEWGEYRRILTAGNDDIDLAGSLENAIGEIQIFLTIQFFHLKNHSASARLTIGGGSNPAPLFQGTIGPGEEFQYCAGEAGAGRTITPGTADMIRVTSDAPDAYYSIYFAGNAIYDFASASGVVIPTSTAVASLAIAATASAASSPGSLATPSLAVPGASSAIATCSSYAAPSLTMPS